MIWKTANRHRPDKGSVVRRFDSPIFPRAQYLEQTQETAWTRVRC